MTVDVEIIALWAFQVLLCLFGAGVSWFVLSWFFRLYGGFSGWWAGLRWELREYRDTFRYWRADRAGTSAAVRDTRESIVGTVVNDGAIYEVGWPYEILRIGTRRAGYGTLYRADDGELLGRFGRRLGSVEEVMAEALWYIENFGPK